MKYIEIQQLSNSPIIWKQEKQFRRVLDEASKITGKLIQSISHRVTRCENI